MADFPRMFRTESRVVLIEMSLRVFHFLEGFNSETLHIVSLSYQIVVELKVKVKVRLFNENN